MLRVSSSEEVSTPSRKRSNNALPLEVLITGMVEFEGFARGNVDQCALAAGIADVPDLLAWCSKGPTL